MTHMPYSRQRRSSARKLSARRQPVDHRLGAAAVEFAVSMVVVVILTFGAIEIVRLSMLQNSIDYTSYLVARKAMIVGARPDASIAFGEQYLDDLGISNASITIMPSKITDETKVITASVTVPVTGNSWVSPLYFNGNLEATSRILAERAAADMGP